MPGDGQPAAHRLGQNGCAWLEGASPLCELDAKLTTMYPSVPRKQSSPFVTWILNVMYYTSKPRSPGHATAHLHSTRLGPTVCMMAESRASHTRMALCRICSPNRHSAASAPTTAPATLRRAGRTERSWSALRRREQRTPAAQVGWAPCCRMPYNEEQIRQLKE